MKKNKLNIIFSETGCPADGILQKYLNGELTHDQKHEIERHLIDCERCSDELEGLKIINNPEELNAIVERINTKINTKSEIRKLKPFYSFMKIAAAIIILVAIGSLFVLFNNKNIDSKKFLAKNENSDSLLKQTGTTKQDTPEFNPTTTKPVGSSASKKLLAQNTHGVAKNQEKGVRITDEKLLFATTMTKLEKNKQKLNNGDAILDSTSLAYIEPKSATGTSNSDNDTYFPLKTGETTSTGTLTDSIMGVTEETEEELTENSQATNKGKKSTSQRQQVEASRPVTKTIEQDEVITGGYPDNNPNESVLKQAINDYNAKKYTDAKTKIEQVLKNSDSPYFQKAQWYYALTLIKLNKITKAKKILKIIINTPNHSFSEKAEQKLKEIEN